MGGRESDRLKYSETAGPFTWGEGRREHAAGKGNTYRICKTGNIRANLTVGNSEEGEGTTEVPLSESVGDAG